MEWYATSGTAPYVKTSDPRGGRGLPLSGRAHGVALSNGVLIQAGTAGRGGNGVESWEILRRRVLVRT